MQVIRKFRRMVAPYVGAWIETYRTSYNQHQEQVAPYVGAWIETCKTDFAIITNIKVAPYVGAWIETEWCL